MNHVELSVESIGSPDWIDNVIPFIDKVLKLLKIDNWEISLLLCDDPFIQKLNKEYRQKDEPTDVLSFEQGDAPDFPGIDYHYAGDLIISLETLAKNAEYFNVDREEEFKRLIIHGILHLAGWDHSDNSPEQEMLVYQEEILEKLKKDGIF